MSETENVSLRRVVLELLRELEAADIIIDQLEAIRRAAWLRKEEGFKRTFTLRRANRQDLIDFAKEELKG